MSISVEALWKMSDVELITAYHEARRQYVEKRFARDSQRARLEWMKAKAFVAGYGGVSERKNAVDSSGELGRKGQEVREMTRDLDLLWRDRSELGELPVAVAGSLRAEHLDVAAVQTSPAFHRFRVSDGGETCVVDLIAEPVPAIETPATIRDRAGARGAARSIVRRGH